MPVASGLSGIDALHEIMRWKNARGTETERPVDAPRTIQGPWLHVFLEALRKAKPSVEEPEAPLAFDLSARRSQAADPAEDRKENRRDRRYRDAVDLRRR